ncbi:MAG TPA: hypothetical protein VF338_12255, partial [Leptolinea sp.]
MLGFVPIFLLLGAAIAVAILQFVPRGAGIAWIVAVLVSIVAWVMVIVMRSRLPFSFAGQFWINLGFKDLLPAFQIDIINWPFVLSICGIVAGALITSSFRIGLDSSNAEWAAVLAFGALAIFGCIASNILTILFILGFVDLLELALIFFSKYEEDSVSSNLKFMIWHIASLIIFVAAYGWQMSLTGTADDWNSIQLGPGFLIFAGCIIRLGLIPFFNLIGNPKKTPDGLYVTRNLTGFLIVISLILQLPFHPIESQWKPIILVLLLITAIAASYRIARNEKRLNQIVMWQVLIGSLISSEYILGYSGGGIFLAITIVSLYLILNLNYPVSAFSKTLGIISLVSLSGLPFTPNSTGFSGFGWIGGFPGFTFLFPIIFIFYSSIRQILEKKNPENPLAERWSSIIAPAGLIIPVITPWVVSLFWQPETHGLQISTPALIVTFAGLGLFLIWQLKLFDFERITKIIGPKYLVLSNKSFSFITDISFSVDELVHTPFNFITNLFEGDGG